LEKLGINLNLLIAQALNFLILLFLLRLLLYKPVLKMFRERRQKIKESLEHAEQVRAEAAVAQAEFEQKLGEARLRSQEALTRATQAGEKAREEIVAQAHQEASSILERAHQEIELERQQAAAELRREVADLVVVITRKVLGKAMDEQAHRRLISEFLEKEKELL
jgi:F-type H+-transporting ATPase subunit b